jgi:hypothetical protein
MPIIGSTAANRGLTARTNGSDVGAARGLTRTKGPSSVDTANNTSLGGNGAGNKRSLSSTPAPSMHYSSSESSLDLKYFRPSSALELPALDLTDARKKAKVT